MGDKATAVLAKGKLIGGQRVHADDTETSELNKLETKLAVQDDLSEAEKARLAELREKQAAKYKEGSATQALKQ